MKTLASFILGLTVSLTVAFILVVVVIFQGCQKPCDGYEAVETGSKCRNLATGEYTSAENCNC